MTPRERSLLTIKQIADQHGCTVEQVLGPSRKAVIVRARFEAYATLSDRLKPYQIGKIFNRERTTVLHGVARARGAK